MKSPLSHPPGAATSATPGRLGSFLRFVGFGGGVGVLSGAAVPPLAVIMPWAGV